MNTLNNTIYNILLYEMQKPKIISLFETTNVSDYTILNEQIMNSWLSSDDQSELYNGIVLMNKIKSPGCYLCMKKTQKIHWFYHSQCPDCGDTSLKFRNLKRDLTGYHAIVTGARLKLGYQIALKLLRAGAEVLITSRKWEEAFHRYQEEPDYSNFVDRLHVMRFSFDLLKISEQMELFQNELQRVWPDKCVDIIIHNAAQTIANVLESDSSSSNSEDLTESPSSEDSFYNDQTKTNKRKRYPLKSWFTNPFPEVDKYGRVIDRREKNSWTTEFGTVDPNELNNVLMANVTAPFIINQMLLPYLKNTFDIKKRKPFIIHVHAKEGHFSSHKTNKHTHTNVAKAGLHMLTRCMASQHATIDILSHYQSTMEDTPWVDRYKRNHIELGHHHNNLSHIGNWVNVHGIDPGWFSKDEYNIDTLIKRNILCPPIDEIDAASRIVYPIFENLPSFPGTWRHYIPLLDY